MEVSTGEIARTAATNQSKLFHDKLKSVLATKAHLNHILTDMKHIPANTISNIKLPIVQIMDLNCYVYSFNLVDKGLYCVRDVCSFVYPRRRYLSLGAWRLTRDPGLPDLD